MSHGIEARGICTSFAIAGVSTRILDGVDLQLRPGRLTALVGASGSGKSTLLQALGLLTPPDSGQVLVGGTDAWSVDDNTRAELRRRHLGFVFQASNLIPQHDSQTNVALAHRAGTARGRRRAGQLLLRMGVRQQAGSRPVDLSGGEQQRVALARALINDPPVLLADEPTGNLDSANEDRVLGLLHEIADEGRAVLVVTHSVHVADGADTVVRLDAGKLSVDRGVA